MLVVERMPFVSSHEKKLLRVEKSSIKKKAGQAAPLSGLSLFYTKFKWLSTVTMHLPRSKGNQTLIQPDTVSN